MVTVRVRIEPQREGWSKIQPRGCLIARLALAGSGMFAPHDCQRGMWTMLFFILTWQEDRLFWADKGGVGFSSLFDGHSSLRNGSSFLVITQFHCMVLRDCHLDRGDPLGVCSRLWLTAFSRFCSGDNSIPSVEKIMDVAPVHTQSSTLTVSAVTR